MEKSFKIWMEERYPQSINQQPQVTSNNPRSPVPGQPPWNTPEVAEIGQVVKKSGQGIGLSSKNTEQQAKKTLDQQQNMKQDKVTAFPPHDGAQGGPFISSRRKSLGL